ncbi:MAG: diguanylate cyclase (GGDEF)-like protein [Planctomycetota bacterium]|jgi:diguanylate cyclase (GGDEF)-like protein
MNPTTDMTKESMPEILSLAQIQHLMRVEFSRAQRYSYPIICMVVTVDQLGALRDRLGYEVKEIVIEAIIALLHAQTRGSDFIGRLPDDRFMIVVPHSMPDEVEIMAKRLVSGAVAMSIPELEGDGITLSIGGSFMIRGETLFFDDLLQTAQRCLAQVASDGGNGLLMESPSGAL